MRRAAADVEAGVPVSLAGAEDEGAVAAATVNIVDTAELLDVIAKWGWIVDSPLQAHQLTPSEPPVTGLTPSGAITPSGTRTYRDLHIVASVGNGITCTDKNADLTLINMEVDARDYGMWFEGKRLSASHVIFRTHGGGNDYGARAYPTQSWRTDHCTFDNTEAHIKAAGRFINCPDFLSESDTFKGGRLMLGGGAAVESDNQLPFMGTLRNAKIACETVEVYAASSVRFEQCDFTGSGHCTPWTGCTVVCVGCTKDGAPLTASFFRNNAQGVTIQ